MGAQFMIGSTLTLLQSKVSNRFKTLVQKAAEYAEMSGQRVTMVFHPHPDAADNSVIKFGKMTYMDTNDDYLDALNKIADVVELEDKEAKTKVVDTNAFVSNDSTFCSNGYNKWNALAKETQSSQGESSLC